MGIIKENISRDIQSQTSQKIQNQTNQENQIQNLNFLTLVKKHLTQQ